jgi:molybdenum cofactor cytidylyltransferase
MPNLQAVILAAGSSRRFPSNKLLRPLPDRRCLLDISAQLASVLTPQVLLVVNDDPQLQAHCRTLRYPFTVNAQAHTGMASSIAAAVTATADAEAWAIFLADMPCIQPATLQALTDIWPAHEITVPTYQQQTGHPVIFSHSWFDALCALHGDRGARALLRNNPAVHYVETADSGVCFDIDTEADWQTYLEQARR